MTEGWKFSIEFRPTYYQKSWGIKSPNKHGFELHFGWRRLIVEWDSV